MEIVAEAALRAEESETPDGLALRLSFLQLEDGRIDRQIKQARLSADRQRQAELAKEQQQVRSEMQTVMGQNA